MNNSELNAMIEKLCFAQGSLGDKLLGLSIGRSPEAYRVALLLSVAMDTLDVLTDAYLRNEDGVEQLANDAKIKELYGETMSLLFL